MKNNKRVLIVSGYTDMLREQNYSHDNSCEEVFDLTLPSKQRYAKHHGYDLLALRSFGKDKHNIFLETDIGHLRFIRSIEMLFTGHYDAVFWIDADSLITNFNYKLEDFVKEDVVFAASWDWMHRLSMSTGNFIIQKTQQLEALYNIFYQIGKTFNSEQESLNSIWRGNILNITPLEHKFLGSTLTKEQIGPGWETRPEVIGPWSKDCFLVHVGGVSNFNRIRLLNQYFREYL